MRGKLKRITKKKWQTEIHFSDDLPIAKRHQEIAAAITQNQVIILAGETGSGKTTQLPKICLSLGYGENGMIAHTQPRRIAARTVADRIASELKTPLGDGVGYQVRFTDKSSDNTRIKLMTDGVLLAEFQHDRMLRKYDVIIIDEAHERSLNIDFLLGLLKPLCHKRPDLKVIITSATIDLDKFSQHFSFKGRPAPIIEVSGRTYPVETIYKPSDDQNPALADQITDTVSELVRDEAKGQTKASGDILVFCAGEREIRDAAQALRQSKLEIEVLPLYSRLSVNEQNKVFQPAQRRKVVLATNVAETSITVPGIAYVIDPGVARISRYSFRSKIQRLPIEAISQASANQRKGRCGRVANGVCIRLYSQQDFEQRAEYTPAEILRSNLASVILKMLRLGIKDIEAFDFLDQPDRRLVNDGFKLLKELGAINDNDLLSAIGRQMSELSVDPKFSRILIEANKLGCLNDALVVISALSIQDPRERPSEHQAAADQAHRALQDSQSDFSSYLILWQSINNAREELSNAKFKQHCLSHFWSIARVFEWRELHRQLLSQCKSLKWNVDKWQKLSIQQPAKKDLPKKDAFSKRYEALHRALISGLLSNIATKEIDEKYIATRSRHIHLFPASSQAKRKPKWVISAEYLETSRLFAHTVAEITPNWIVDAASHLCKYTYSSPHYHIRSGTIKAYRKTLLYGLVLRNKEAVNYALLKPNESRQIYIQQALVEGNYQPQPNVADFVDYNKALISEIEKLETKTRRRNLLVNERIVFQFYEDRLPAQINNRQALEKWVSEGNHSILKLDKSLLQNDSVSADEVAQFPDKVTVHGKEVKISYKFDPSSESDGVTMIVPIAVLAPFPDHAGDWLVPGLLKEKCIALIKTLPKVIRRHYAPASMTIERIYPDLTPNESPLTEALAERLYKTRGVKVSQTDFDLSKLDDYYQMNYRVMDVDGSLIEESRDLVQLKQHYADAVQDSVHSNNAPQRLELEHHQITEWSFPELNVPQEYQHQGMTVRAYPMLKLRSDGSLSYLLHDQEDAAKYHSHYGLIALAQSFLSNSTQTQSLKYLRKELMKVERQPAKNSLNSLADKLKQVTPNKTEKSDWIERLISAGLLSACFASQDLGYLQKDDFFLALKQGAKQWVPKTLEIESALLAALSHREMILRKLSTVRADDIEADRVIEDIKMQVYRLFHPSFLSYTSLENLRQYPRYLRAIESRIEKLTSIGKANHDEAALQALQQQLDLKIEELQAKTWELDFVFLTKPKLFEFSLMLEEWRVSIYAQHLRARIKVSEKRLRRYWENEVS